MPGGYTLAWALPDEGLWGGSGAADAGRVTPPRYDRHGWKPGDGVFNSVAMDFRTVDNSPYVADAGGEELTLVTGHGQADSPAWRVCACTCATRIPPLLGPGRTTSTSATSSAPGSRYGPLAGQHLRATSANNPGSSPIAWTAHGFLISVSIDSRLTFAGPISPTPTPRRRAMGPQSGASAGGPPLVCEDGEDELVSPLPFDELASDEVCLLA